MINTITTLKNENESLKRENHQLQRALNKESEDPASEKISRFDPFVYLPELCHSKILKHIHGFDLYNMTKVSSLWKSIVKNDFRADLNLFAFQRISIQSLKDILDAATDRRDIEYTHMVVRLDYPTSLPLDHLVKPSLECLSVESSIHWFKIQRANFRALRKLIIKENLIRVFDWIAECQFPALTSFAYLNMQGEECHWNEISFDSMPKLKRLHLEADLYEESINFYSESSFNDPPFQLEKLTCRLYSEKFCRSSAESLKKLKCNVMDFLDYQNLLLTLTSLESLSISIEHYQNYLHDAPFPLARNYKITKLEYGSNDISHLTQILASLPELESLVIYQKLKESILDVAGEKKNIFLNFYLIRMSFFSSS